MNKQNSFNLHNFYHLAQVHVQLTQQLFLLIPNKNIVINQNALQPIPSPSIINNQLLEMLLKVHYGKETHLLNRRVDYQELHQFIRKTFKTYPKNFELTYLDSDNDAISISNDDDLNNLYGTAQGSFTKVTITDLNTDSKNSQIPSELVESSQTTQKSTVQEVKDSSKYDSEKVSIIEKQEEQEEHEKEQQKQRQTDVRINQNKKEEAKEQAKQDQRQQIEQKIAPQLNKLITIQQAEASEVQVDSSEEYSIFKDAYNHLKNALAPKKESVEGIKLSQKQNKIGNEKQQDNESNKKQQNIKNTQKPKETQKGEVKYKMQQKELSSNQVDKLLFSRLDECIPYIYEKIKKLMSQEKMEENNQIHKVECQICLIQSIKGIRYKCTTCPNYNLCSLCEEKTIHPHNLIKMRKPQTHINSERTFTKPSDYKLKQDNERHKEKQKPIYKPKQSQPDPKLISEIMKNVKEIIGDTLEVESFVYQNYKEGVDRIINMWFNK